MSEQPDFPPFVYAPVVERDGQRHLAMDQLVDGRTAVFVYSAIDRLRDLYDADQPWVVASPETLSQAHADVAYDVLLLDTAFERHDAPAVSPSIETAPDPQAQTAAPRGVFVAGATTVATKSLED